MRCSPSAAAAPRQGDYGAKEAAGAGDTAGSPVEHSDPRLSAAGAPPRGGHRRAPGPHTMPNTPGAAPAAAESGPCGGWRALARPARQRDRRSGCLGQPAPRAPPARRSRRSHVPRPGRCRSKCGVSAMLIGRRPTGERAGRRARERRRRLRVATMGDRHADARRSRPLPGAVAWHRWLAGTGRRLAWQPHSARRGRRPASVARGGSSGDTSCSSSSSSTGLFASPSPSRRAHPTHRAISRPACSHAHPLTSRPFATRSLCGGLGRDRLLP
jgi:hypothetical protein